MSRFRTLAYQSTRNNKFLSQKLAQAENGRIYVALKSTSVFPSNQSLPSTRYTGFPPDEAPFLTLEKMLKSGRFTSTFFSEKFHPSEFVFKSFRSIFFIFLSSYLSGCNRSVSLVQLSFNQAVTTTFRRYHDHRKTDVF